MKKIFLSILSLILFSGAAILAGLDEELLEAVKNNNYSKAQQLLNCGANPNRVTTSVEFHRVGSWFTRTDGKIDANALAVAIMKYNFQMVKMLIECGANIKLPFKFTETSSYDQGDEEKLYSLTPSEILNRLNVDSPNQEQYSLIRKFITERLQQKI